MIQLSNKLAQTLNAGQAIIFDNASLKTGCAEYHRIETGTVRLKCDGVYSIHFSGNIAVPTGGTTGQIQVGIALDGVPLPESTMIVTPDTEEQYWNVSKTFLYRNGDPSCPCCNDAHVVVSVVNDGILPLTVAPGATLSICRKS